MRFRWLLHKFQNQERRECPGKFQDVGYAHRDIGAVELLPGEVGLLTSLVLALHAFPQILA